jgi:hypothetical protein
MGFDGESSLSCSIGDNFLFHIWSWVYLCSKSLVSLQFCTVSRLDFAIDHVADYFAL